MTETTGNFDQKLVLSVKVIRYRDISVGWFHDKYPDTPDPYITVNCPWLDKKQTYSTLVKANLPTAEVNETFRFVIPKHRPKINQPVEIKICDEDFLWDDTVGRVVFDAAKLTVGKNLLKTFTLKEKRGELDVEFRKYLQREPGFRLSTDICSDEKDFRKQRIPKVKDAIQKLLGELSPNFNLEETPVISVVGSGGGYRAAIGMSGGMAALKDAGVLDTLTYASGLSGSSWYLCSAYSQDGVRKETQEEYHKWLQRQMEQSVFSTLLSPSFFAKYMKKVYSAKSELDQPVTCVDYYGYALGESLLAEKNDQTMSHLRPAVEGGKVPYPILTSVHLKDHVPSHEFHVHIENTPHEISMPRFGVNIATEQFGSHWDEGVVTRECPEFPLHYYLGKCGGAFSVLLNGLFKHGSEINPDFLAEIEELRRYGSKSFAVTLSEESRTRDVSTSVNPVEAANQLLPKGIRELIRKFFTERFFLFDRTAQIRNFAYNFGHLHSVYIAPEDISDRSEFQQKIIEKMGYRKEQDLDTDIDHMCLTDAGIVQNVNMECVLRKPRFSDLIIVFDMNGYESDEHFDYMPIIQSAEHAWRNGLHFPPIRVKKLVNESPTEFLVFESDSDDCPTVLWFTLCNKIFKDIKDYKPKMEFDASMNDGRPFNDFPVYGENSNYKTLKLEYSNLEFQQLHELMYHNVMSCIPHIKAHMTKAVERKKRREGLK